VSREIHTGDLEHLGQLPGTRVEGERIASMLGVKPLLGEEALEARIKACRWHAVRRAFCIWPRTASFWPISGAIRNGNCAVSACSAGQAGDGFGQMSGRISRPGMAQPIAAFGSDIGWIQDLANRRELAGGG
jgi:hypothetical protein